MGLGDLVPRENAELWLRYLRHSTPTLPFRSSSSSSPTAPALLRLLKAYKPSKAHLITVGVVGYPNVGKSSLINALKRAHVRLVSLSLLFLMASRCVASLRNRDIRRSCRR
jgi:nuclear GTP-binding protein